VAPTPHPRVATLTRPEAFRDHLASREIDIAFDETVDVAALARPLERSGIRVGNRFCILPMEGWDGTHAGEPSDLTRRRWRNFGRSGAKLIWGGEATAVRPDGRANPNQLMLEERTLPAIAALREELVAAHRERFGPRADADLFVGLQLTHSGRFARPSPGGAPEPLVAHANPVLDRRSPVPVRVVDDADLERLASQFVEAARLAFRAGFAFVDVKSCHGYLGHELLSGRERPGRYGGDLENRTRFLRGVVAGIRSEVPQLQIGVRLSVLDAVPYRSGPGGVGEPEVPAEGYTHGFGLIDGPELDTALAEPRRLLGELEALGVGWICASAGSPYYCPHVVRPALFPPTDGYEPPEDPLRGVARQIEATARLKSAFPGMTLVGSAYSYLQEWIPNVAGRTVREGKADFVGLGRVVLSYPDLPADVLEGKPRARTRLCRTFSDCTSGPRSGLVSGCFPLDPEYARHPDAARLREIKAARRGAGGSEPGS
jgi:NADPH2 dehydrogenase